MSIAEKHPRAKASQQFVARQHSAPETELTSAPLFREEGLTVQARRKLYSHLSSIEAVSGRSFGALYSEQAYASVSESVVYGARGTRPKLLWVMTTSHGTEITIPAFVARCLNLPDTTDPLTSLRFTRDTAGAAHTRKHEERTRRAGRSSGVTMSELRDAENASAGRLLVAESNLADAVSAQALDRRATLVAASVPWTPEFEAEQDRLFDAAQRGDELPPLSVRLAAAADYAVAAAADAEQARSAVSDWNSSASMRLRENGFVTFSQALGR